MKNRFYLLTNEKNIPIAVISTEPKNELQLKIELAIQEDEKAFHCEIIKPAILNTVSEEILFEAFVMYSEAETYNKKYKLSAISNY